MYYRALCGNNFFYYESVVLLVIRNGKDIRPCGFVTAAFAFRHGYFFFAAEKSAEAILKLCFREFFLRLFPAIIFILHCIFLSR